MPDETVFEITGVYRDENGALLEGTPETPYYNAYTLERLSTEQAILRVLQVSGGRYDEWNFDDGTVSSVPPTE